jgi:hypothetical protein
VFPTLLVCVGISGLLLCIFGLRRTRGAGKLTRFSYGLAVATSLALIALAWLIAHLEIILPFRSG